MVLTPLARVLTGALLVHVHCPSWRLHGTTPAVATLRYLSPRRIDMQGSSLEVGSIRALHQTGGYTAFVEDWVRPTVAFQYPCGDNSGATVDCPGLGRSTLVLAGSSSHSIGHTNSWGKYTISVRLRATMRINNYCRECMLTFTSQRGTTLDVIGLLHWAWGGNRAFIFLPAGSTAATWNRQFRAVRHISFNLKSVALQRQPQYKR